jgi:hypothetical protein
MFIHAIKRPVQMYGYFYNRQELMQFAKAGALLLSRRGQELRPA